MEQNKNKKRNNLRPDFNTTVYGKIPPQAKDLEEAVLGAILHFRDAYDQASSILKAECFYVDAHQRIFKAMQDLANGNKPIDQLTVSEELRTREELEMIGGPYYLTKITNQVVSPAHTEAHARIIYQKFIQREIIRVTGEAMSLAFDDSADAFDLLSELESSVSAISTASVFGDMVGMDTVLVQAIKQIEHWRTLDSTITGVPSGFDELDRITRGWQNGDLIIIAARPSKGKTAFMLSQLRSAAIHFQRKKSCKAWSLEMKAMRLVFRMLASESKELLYRIQTGRIDDEQMAKLYREGIQKLSRLMIYFDDTSGVNLRKLRAKAKKKTGNVETGIIFLDYLQLMTPDGSESNREQEVSKISRGLKNTALEMNIPIIALSQLSREIEKRSDGKPRLSDLRESGSLEQDADVVIFLYTPTEKQIEEDASLSNRVYIDIAKHRDGMLDTIELDFKSEYQLFTEKGFMDELPGNWKPVREVVDYTEANKKE